jgi:membrane-associated protease RseP (regulator of RpoE activity)
MNIPEQSTLTELITPIFRVDDVTVGRDAAGYLYRYRGLLTVADSAAAYDQLSEALHPYGMMPLFRKEEDGRHLILLVALPATPVLPNPIYNIILFVLTFLCMMFAGAVLPTIPQDDGSDIAMRLQYILTGLPFALSMMSILLVHELGHYFASRYHKMAVTLPFFIPFPSPPFGTMGAVIQLKEAPKNKRTLLDVGIAGPLAGLVVAVPLLFIGLSQSALGPIPATPNNFLEGNSILYLFAKFAVFHQMLPAPATYSMPPVLQWLAYFFSGMPSPAGGTDVFLGPVAWAAWGGLLVTSLNLIPAGQLDGGHMLYVLIGGKRLRALLPALMIMLTIFGIFSYSWLLWVLLLNFFGRMTDEPRDQITELGPGRRALAIFGVVVFFLVFMPVPFPASIFSFFQP